MLNIRAERLIAGDVIFYGDSSWRVLSIGRSTRPPKLDLVTPGDCRAGPRLSGHPPRLSHSSLKSQPPRKEDTLSYPKTIDDLAPDQRVSDPVVTIDYDRLGGFPSEAREAILKAVTALDRLSDNPRPHKGTVAYNRPLVGPELDEALAKAQFDWKRLERLHARFSEDSVDGDLFDRLTRHEINAWAIKENRPLIETS